MANSASHKQYPFNLDMVLKRPLGRTLLFSLLGAALLAPIFWGLWGYHTADRRLQQDIRQHIRTNTELKYLGLRTLFDNRPSTGDTPSHSGLTGTLLDRVNQILDVPSGPPSGWRTYLLDSDKTVVAGNPGSRPQLGRIIADIFPTRQWQEHGTRTSVVTIPPPPQEYVGPAGDLVLGTYAALQLGDTPYLLVVELATATAYADRNRLRSLWLSAAILAAAGAIVLSLALANRIVGPLDDLARRLVMACKGSYDPNTYLAGGRDVGALSLAATDVIKQLKAARTECGTQSRLMQALLELHRLLDGKRDLEDLCLQALEYLSGVLDLTKSGFFLVEADGRLTCIGRYPGHPDDEPHPESGSHDRQAGHAIEARTVTFLRKDPVNGLVASVPKPEQATIIVVTLRVQHTVKGILELEKPLAFNRYESRFVEAAAVVITAVLDTVLTRHQQSMTTDQPARTGALEAREAALRAQSRAFRAAEEKLQLKQLELEAANAQMMKNAADLEAHMAILEKQKKDMQKQNAELEKTHQELEEKARQLEMSSRYKTEFMANMSHELRTPLNSILLLSRLLLENKEKTLTPKQTEFAKTVHSAGEDLLNLINEILDLAKVESGKMEVELAPVSIHAVTKSMLVSFAPLAEQNGIAFNIHVDPDVPDQITTDRKRLEQIVKNFLSNAFKFTSQGSVRMEIALSSGTKNDSDTLTNHDSHSLAISVVDTGIGIPRSKQKMVFEAFQQVDGSTRRKYGGTGLGLSISRELARILGGKITLQSEDGAGSRFTLYLPITPLPENEPAIIRTDAFGAPGIPANASEQTAADPKSPIVEPVPDDRHRVAPGDKSILIIDADATTTETIKAAAYRNGFKVLIAEQFPTGLHFADYYLPAVIFVNLDLPGAGGWNMVHRIKANLKNRHASVFAMSATDETRQASASGAVGHIRLPVASGDLSKAFRRLETLRTKQTWQVLVVAPKRESATRIADAIGIAAVRVLIATTADKADAILKSKTIDAVILHPATDATIQQAIVDSLQHNPTPAYHFSGTASATHVPVAPEPLNTMATPRRIASADQLLSTLVSDLYLPIEALDSACRDRLQAMDDHRNVFKGRNILLVDDDMRTVFAVSNVLEDQGAKVYTGKTGKESLDKMDGFPNIDLILMDVMVSDVDGYQAIRDIRSRNRYRTLPIIALTAKAMQGDRAECLQAGADDYLAKPVNLDKLTSMLKIWLEPQRVTAQRSTIAQPG